MKKTFVLTVSKQFPKSHNRAGQTTGFVENIKRLFNKISTLSTILNHWIAGTVAIKYLDSTIACQWLFALNIIDAENPSSPLSYTVK